MLAAMPARFRLRELLDEEGIGQTELAREAELSFATVNRLCTNATAQVSLETLDKIISALERRGLEVRMDDIIERTPPKRRGRG
jgi:DNA-binding Xre family transcriptional regulator